MTGAPRPRLAPVSLSPATAAGGTRIEAVAPGGWTVEGTWRPGVLLVGPERFSHWANETALDPAMLDEIGHWPSRPDLLLAGTGPAMTRPQPSLGQAAARLGLRLEWMGSRAAARTYNVLVAEGRAVAALLAPV